MKSEELPRDYVQVNAVREQEYEQAVNENDRNMTVISLLDNENNSFLCGFKAYDYSDGTLVELN